MDSITYFQFIFCEWRITPNKMKITHKSIQRQCIEKFSAHAFTCQYQHEIHFLVSHRKSYDVRIVHVRIVRTVVVVISYYESVSQCVCRRWPWKRLGFIELWAKIVCASLLFFVCVSYFVVSKQTFDAASRLYYVRRVPHTILPVYISVNVRNSCLSTILHTLSRSLSLYRKPRVD